MASSLEELLAEEGLTGRKSTTRSRASFRSDNITNRHNSDSSSSNRVKTQRTRSDTSRYSFGGRLEGSDSIGDRQPHNNLILRERIHGKRAEVLKGKHSVERPQDRRLELNSNAHSSHEIVEVGVQKGKWRKDICLNEVNDPLGSDEHPSLIDGRKGSMGKDMKSDGKEHVSSKKHLFEDSSSPDNGGTSMRQPGSVDERTRRGLWNSKSFQYSRTEKHAPSIFSDSLLALNEVAIRATISILNGYIIPFLKDKHFQVRLRDKCFSSLNFMASKVYHDTENKVIFNLEQAIETVEKSAKDHTSTKDLKRALLQLSVITGLNTDKLKYGLTCGIPNYKLSACAHLYLSVFHKLQRKDRVSAKHILQVFADSPLHGRTHLLPELWENFFYPHLSHLKPWHSQEVNPLVGTHSGTRKLKLLNKMYDGCLDCGTYQFAVYYKYWLAEANEAPAFPLINICSVSLQTVQLSDSPIYSGESSDPVSDPYGQPMVSKKLYEAVFGRSSKP